MLNKSVDTMCNWSSFTQGVFAITETTPDILDCDELRYFWVRWDQGVEIGLGRIVGVDVVAQLTDYIGKDIRHVSFATGAGQIGEWHMHNSEGNCDYIYT